MEIEEFSVPYNLEELVKPSAAVDNVKKELKRFTRSKCQQIFQDGQAYDLIAWAADQCKSSDAHTLALAEVLEELAGEASSKLKHFYKTKDNDLQEDDAIVCFKKASCLVLLFLKATLKVSKSSIMQNEESKKLKSRITDPILAKQLALLVFLSRAIESYGNEPEIADTELCLHLLEIAFKFAKCSVVNDGTSIEHLTKLIRNLMLYKLCQSHEFNAKLLNLLEDGAEEGAQFLGKFMASLLINGKENLAELANDSIMRLNEILMTKKYVESPLYKNSREFLMEIVVNEPIYFYNNFGVFVVLLGCENYSIRTFVCEGMLTSSLFLKEKAFTDNAVKQKILKFFEIVCERSHDKNSFARSAVLNYISSYIAMGLLDDDAYFEVFSIAIERMADSSAIVRKRALVLLQELCLYFKPKLIPFEQLTSEIEKCEAGQIKNEESDTGFLIENPNSENDSSRDSKSKQSKIITEIDSNDQLEYDESLGPEAKSKRKGRKTTSRSIHSSALKNMDMLEDKFEEQDDEDFLIREDKRTPHSADLANNTLLAKLKFYEGIYKFLFESLANIRVLIYSRNASDIIESLRLLYIYTQMEISEVRGLFLEAFKLIWTKEHQIKDELLQIFHRVFIRRYSVEHLIDTLVGIFDECDPSSRVSLEEIITQLFRRDCDEREGRGTYGPTRLPIAIRRNLWEQFLQTYTNKAFHKKTVVVLRLLKLCVSHYPQWILENVGSIFNVIKHMMFSNFDSFEVLAEFGSVMVCLRTGNVDLREVIVKSLTYFLFKYQGTEDPYYMQYVEKVIYAIFNFKRNPEVVCDYLVKRLAGFMAEDGHDPQSQPIFENVDEYIYVPLTQVANNAQGNDDDVGSQRYKLIHLIVAAGHIALKFLFYFEKVDDMLQIRRSATQTTQAPNELEEAIGGVEAEYEAQKEALCNLINKKIFKESLLSRFVPIFLSIIKREMAKAHEADGTSGVYSQSNNFFAASQGNLGYLSHGHRMDQSQKSNGLQYSSQPNFVHTRAKAHSQQNDLNKSFMSDNHFKRPSQADECETINLLVVAALDSLCKYMIVSSALCTEHLDLIFNIVEDLKAPSYLSTNAIIYLGDLCHKHPNILGPHMGRLFNCLKSLSPSIRRTAVGVLSHLILNDFIKLKAEVADFVFLLDDEDPQIVGSANFFFQQLSEKDSKFIYNILPDAISRLSFPEEQGGVSELKFEKFAKFFFKFVQKDKIVENLIEKLLLRIKSNENEKEVRNIIYCIFCLVNNDRSLQKLSESIETLKLAVDVRDTGHILKNLIFRLRKNVKINKATLDELEGILFQSTEAVFSELKKRKQEKQKPKRGRKAKQ